ncbi:glycosyl transferase family protein, partial [mine drainage metagenome]
DDDDLWTAEKLPYVRARFAARPELVYLCHAHRAIDAAGAPVDARHPELADKDPRRFATWDGRDFDRLLRSIWPGNNSSMVVRSAWAREQVPLLRASGWSSDLAWLVAVLSSGSPLEIDPAVLSDLRLHDQNMSQTRGSGPEGFRERHRVASERFARSNGALARIARERGRGPPNLARSLAARAEGFRFFADLEGARHARAAAWRALRDAGARQDPAVRGTAMVALLSPAFARRLLFRSSQRRWALQHATPPTGDR